MKFQTRKLHLFENLYFSNKADFRDKKTIIENENLIDESESLFCYENTVDKTQVEPKREHFLTNKIFLGYKSFEKTEIFLAKGNYLFVQAPYKDEKLIFEAAEALFLESLWQNIDFIDNKVFLRILEEDGQKIFQLFRAI